MRLSRLRLLLLLLIVAGHAGVLNAAGISDLVRQTAAAGDRVWVFISDKGPDAGARARAKIVPPRAAARIAARGSTFDPRVDLPVHNDYRHGLQQAGMVIKNESRWLNAVAGWIHPEDLPAIARLPFVDSLRPVVTFRRPEIALDDLPTPSPRRAATSEDVFDYGGATVQIQLMGVQYLHRAGLSGRGVRIGMMDTGFSLGIRAFDCLDIQGTRDFINGDDDVGDNEASQMRHGTQCLSLCGGFDEGQMVGVAPGAQFVVAKTELVDLEIEAEEDNWVAGLEWLDSMGCDIVSSSLGYVNWYGQDDFDGNTAPSTIAADLAAARGVLVVNAAGNYGCGDGDIRIIVPADGDSVLAVGASTFEGVRASFSSCGPTSDGRIKPDVIAPGQGVWLALPNTRMYQPGNGTSFATPLVAGVCALLLEQNPALSPYDLILLLRSTADQAIKPWPTYGWGLVQAAVAAGLDTNAIEPVRPFNCSRVAGSVELRPNPASDSVTIKIISGPKSDGDFRVFTISGGLVYEGEIRAGEGTWDGRTAAGAMAAPAVYLVLIRTEIVEEVLKLAWLPRD